MKTSSHRLTVVLAIVAPFLAFYPTAGSAATVTVTVNGSCNYYYCSFFFMPASVTIHPGDTVQWVWNANNHSTTSGFPGMPNGLWDSGILNQGSTFSHTFNTAGTFPYYCRVHGQCCGMTGTVTVTNPSPTPTPSPMPGPPVVTTNPATFIASFSARLDGALDPHGLPTTFHFQYGRTTSYGLTTASQTQTGNTYRNITANISGLMASTTYHFRIVATNSAGTRMGGDRTFTTLSATGAPVVITHPATLIASFSATLNGLLDPHGLTTSVHFQYGPTTGYGLTTAPQSHSGNTYLSIGSAISSLTANTAYHFRIVATNGSGTVYGADQTFTTLSATGAPVVIANGATNVTSSSATLNGTVDPHGLTTSVHFQYGTTTSYGSTTPSQSKTGNTYQTASANVSGLSTSTTYHFRIVATNGSGTIYGADKAFTTP